MSDLLHYHRCDDCLTAFSTTESKVDFCDCNGTVTYMGVVHGDKYVKTEDRSPCDGRCTHASGPMCDCMCGGANHGTGKLVQTVVAEGKIKAVGLTEEDIERAHTFRKLRDYAEQKFNDKYSVILELVRTRVFVGGREYYNMVNDKAAFDKIKKMKVYNSRTVALVDFIKKMVAA